jgi:hypothetical protein
VRVSVSFEDDDEGIGHEVLEMNGELSRINTEEGVAQMEADERDFMASAYMVGVHGIHLGFLPGPTTFHVDGLSFGFAVGGTVAITWPGIEP